jgi:hypothetical protein
MRRQGGELRNNLPHDEVVAIEKKELDSAHDATPASHIYNIDDTATA